MGSLLSNLFRLIDTNVSLIRDSFDPRSEPFLERVRGFLTFFSSKLTFRVEERFDTLLGPFSCPSLALSWTFFEKKRSLSMSLNQLSVRTSGLSSTFSTSFSDDFDDFESLDEPLLPWLDSDLLSLSSWYSSAERELARFFKAAAARVRRFCGARRPATTRGRVVWRAFPGCLKTWS